MPTLLVATLVIHAVILFLGIAAVFMKENDPKTGR